MTLPAGNDGPMNQGVQPGGAIRTANVPREADTYHEIGWPQKPTGKCFEVYSTVVLMCGVQIYLGAPTMDELERAFMNVTHGTLPFHRERVSRCALARLEARP